MFNEVNIFIVVFFSVFYKSNILYKKILIFKKKCIIWKHGTSPHLNSINAHLLWFVRALFIVVLCLQDRSLPGGFSSMHWSALQSAGASVSHFSFHLSVKPEFESLRNLANEVVGDRSLFLLTSAGSNWMGRLGKCSILGYSQRVFSSELWWRDLVQYQMPLSGGISYCTVNILNDLFSLAHPPCSCEGYWATLGVLMLWPKMTWKVLLFSMSFMRAAVSNVNGRLHRIPTFLETDGIIRVCSRIISIKGTPTEIENEPFVLVSQYLYIQKMVLP